MSDYEGAVSLEWPTWPGCADHDWHPLSGWSVLITDVNSGHRIYTATDVRIHASPRDVVTAELTLPTDADGHPIGNGERPSIGEDGGLCTGVFRFLVTAMKAGQATNWPAVGDRVHYVPALEAGQEMSCQEAVIASLKPCPRDTEAVLMLGGGATAEAGRDERYAHPPAVWADDRSGYPAGSWHVTAKCKAPVRA